MGTTAVVAELFVGGVQTLTWLGLIAATVFGPDALWRLAKDPPAALSALALAAAYALGVVFDRLWDSAMDWWKGDEAKKHCPKPITRTDELRREVYGVDPGAAAELVNYTRSRMRVTRASFFNGALITASGLAFLILRIESVRPWQCTLAAAAGLLFCWACGFAHEKLRCTYDHALEVHGGRIAGRSPSAT